MRPRSTRGERSGGGGPRGLKGGAGRGLGPGLTDHPTKASHLPSCLVPSLSLRRRRPPPFLPLGGATRGFSRASAEPGPAPDAPPPPPPRAGPTPRGPWRAPPRPPPPPDARPRQAPRLRRRRVPAPLLSSPREDPQGGAGAPPPRQRVAGYGSGARGASSALAGAALSIPRQTPAAPSRLDPCLAPHSTPPVPSGEPRSPRLRDEPAWNARRFRT